MSEEIKEELELREKRYIYSLKENISFGDEDYKAHIILNYIQDLQQKVEQLEKENEELKEENKRIFQNVNDDELLISNAMNYAELKKAEKRVEQLENIRKEAIEYIKSDSYFDGSGICANDLLNILNKGDKNE